MEVPEVTPPKIRRIQRNTNLYVSECVREFSLPVQFPSLVAGHKPVAREHTLKSPKTFRTFSELPMVLTNIPRNSNNISVANKSRSLHRVIHCPEEKVIRVSSPSGSHEIKNVTKPTSTPIFSNGIKIIQKASSSHLLTSSSKNPVSSTNGDLQTKLQKVKLHRPDGTDLGEFQVKLLGQQGNLKRKFVTISKNASLKDDNQGSAVVSSTQSESMVSYSINDVQYPGMIYQEPRISKVGGESTSKPNIISQISVKGAAGAPIGQVMKNLQSQVVSIKNSQANGSVDFKPVPFIKVDPKKIIISRKDSESSLTNLKCKNLVYLKPEDHPYLKNISQCGKPISLKPLNLKTLSLSKDSPEGKKSSDVSKSTGTGGLQYFQNGDMDEEIENVELTKVYDLETEERHLMHVGQQKQHQLEQSSLNGKKNVIVRMPKRAGVEFSRQSYSGSSSDMGSLQYSDEEDELESSETLDTDDSIDQGLLQRNKFIKNEEPSVVRNKVHKVIRQRSLKKEKMENLMKKSAENAWEDNDGSPDMSILERALASVKNKSLREEALKVLATCKLGGERQVPIRPPSDTISVRETMTQTNIFGNLDRDCEEFIEVKEEAKGIRRVEKGQRNHSLVSKSLNTILTPVVENHTDQYVKQLDSMLGKFDHNIAGVQEVKQIKEVLNKPIRSNERINQIKTQIQKDVKMLTNYDENGLLGLHKAVMEDNNIAVKRLLMILKICKKSVDMKTLDGKVSFFELIYFKYVV